MEKYKEIKKLAEGSFGIVIKAQNTTTGEIVAIKKMKQKYTSWDECINLRELKSLRKLVHVNIVKLKEVVRVNDELSFVFEYLDKNIFQLYDDCKKNGTQLPEQTVRLVFYQIANALSYIHKHGFFHRDMKPENILITQSNIVKLIDFGLAREIRSRPPYTDYVSTRWYRAPEIILRSTNYNSPVDIFALGCIMAELYTMKPLFNGASELDQLNKLCSILGTPNKNDWPEGYRLASLKGINFPAYPTIPLQQVISNAPPDAVQLIAECLRWDSQKRPTATKILQHPYFANIEAILPKELTCPPPDQNQQPQQLPSPLIGKQKDSSSSQQQQHPPNRRLMASREESAKIRENLYSGMYTKNEEDEMGGNNQFSNQNQKENNGNSYYSSNNNAKQQSQQGVSGGGGISLNLDVLQQTTKNSKQTVQSAIDLNSKQFKGGLELNDNPQQKKSVLNTNNSNQLKSKNSFDVDTIYEFLNTADPNQKQQKLGGGGGGGGGVGSGLGGQNNTEQSHQTPSYQDRIKQRDQFSYNYESTNQQAPLVQSNNTNANNLGGDYLSSLSKDRNARATSLQTDTALKGLSSGIGGGLNGGGGFGSGIQRHKNEYSYSMSGNQKTDNFSNGGGGQGFGNITEEPDSLGQYIPSSIQQSSNSSRMRGGGMQQHPITLDSGPRMPVRTQNMNENYYNNNNGSGGGGLQLNFQPSVYQQGKAGQINSMSNSNNNSYSLRNEFNNKSSFDMYNFGNMGGGGGGGTKVTNNNLSFSGSNSSMGLVMPTFGTNQKQYSVGGGGGNDLYNFNNVGMGLPPRKNM